MESKHTTIKIIRSQKKEDNKGERNKEPKTPIKQFTSVSKSSYLSII